MEIQTVTYNEEFWWCRITRANGFIYSSDFHGKNKVGLFYDEGFPCFEYTKGSHADKIRKIYKILKRDFNPIITSKANLQAVNFQDVNRNLTTGKYQPYNKPDYNLLYLNILSNYPPNIIESLPSKIFKKKLQFISRSFKVTRNTGEKLFSLLGKHFPKV